MKYLLITCLFTALTFASCRQETAGPQGHIHGPELQVIYLDILGTCGWNLKITEERTLTDFRGRQDSFLLSDIPSFNTSGQYIFGDTLYVELQVIETIPEDYEKSDIICNRWNGIPVRLSNVHD